VFSATAISNRNNHVPFQNSQFIVGYRNSRIIAAWLPVAKAVETEHELSVNR
jgi:hypothetical protein